MNDNNDFDSDWDDEECEWGELEEFDMPEINLDNKILSKRNFAIYDENEIDTIIMNEISNLSKTLGDLDFDEVYHLFIKHEWNTDKVIEDFLKNGCYLAKRKTNFNSSTTCLICFDDIEPKDQLTICNKHIYCKTCWKGYLTSKINDGCLNICCMDAKCKHKISREFIMECFGQVAFTYKYNRWIRRSFITKNQNYTFCPNAKCNLVTCNNGSNNQIDCKCGNTFCFSCSNIHHYPAPCYIMNTWLEKCNSDSENALWLMENTKNCPKCKLPIEKNSGCNHMTCRNCKHQFCWLCKGAWSEHGSATGGFYRCNKFVEMEKNGEKVNETYEQSRFLHYYSRYIGHNESKTILEKQIVSIEDMLNKKQTSYMLKSITFGHTIKDAINLILKCRETLKFSYPIGFSMENHPQLSLFEYWQQDLEKHCEHLHSLIEVKHIHELWGNKDEIANFYRITKKYHKNLCNELHNLY